MPQYQFRQMSADDLLLMRGWLAQPHVAQWWGDPDTELGYIRDMIEGRDTTRPFIFSVDGEPMGYIQCWFIGHHQNAEWIADHPWLAELPSDTVGVDLSIGDAAQLSQGIGSAAADAYRELRRAQHRARLDEQTTQLDPETMAAQSAAVRALWRVGFD